MSIDMKLEVITIPVSDVDRAKSFYESLGWRLDADFDLGNGMRVVQFTPTHSNCSVSFGSGIVTAEPGSVERTEIVVSDIEAARADLIDRGVQVSEPFHRGPGGFEPGADPQRQSYNSYATFSDPDGNGWILQEVTTRLPGRVWEDRSMDVGEVAQLLHETAEHHDAFEQAAPPHDWWDWYASYFDARQSGSSPDEAAAAAGRYMAEVKHVVVGASG